MKAGIALPLVVLAAWMGIQSQATALQINLPPSIPDAFGSISLESGTSTASENLTFPPFTAKYSTGTNFSTGSTFSSGTVNLQPSPSLSVHASSTGSGLAAATAVLDYVFELYDPFAPQNKSPIPTIFAASGGVSLPPLGSYPNVILQLADYNPNGLGIGDFKDSIFYDYACAGSGGCLGYSKGLPAQLYFSISKDLTLYANTLYEVLMYVSVSSAGNWTSTGFLDPTIEIDPTFADASQYELLSSPGVGNAPLPSTWLMMLSGLAAVGFLTYRGSKKNAAALAAA